MRLRFESKEEFERWVTDHYQRGYEAYCTSKSEVVLVPTKSTRPLLYAYIKHGDKAQIIKFLNGLGIKIYHVVSFDWQEDKMLGARMEVGD